MRRILDSLKDKILVINLLKVLQRLIGLKLFQSLGLRFLGIRAIVVVKYLGMALSSNNSLIASIKLDLMKGQHF